MAEFSGEITNRVALVATHMLGASGGASYTLPANADRNYLAIYLTKTGNNGTGRVYYELAGDTPVVGGSAALFSVPNVSTVMAHVIFEKAVPIGDINIFLSDENTNCVVYEG